MEENLSKVRSQPESPEPRLNFGFIQASRVTYHSSWALLSAHGVPTSVHSPCPFQFPESLGFLLCV